MFTIKTVNSPKHREKEKHFFGISEAIKNRRQTEKYGCYQRKDNPSNAEVSSSKEYFHHA